MSRMWRFKWLIHCVIFSSLHNIIKPCEDVRPLSNLLWGGSCLHAWMLSIVELTPHCCLLLSTKILLRRAPKWKKFLGYLDNPRIIPFVLEHYMGYLRMQSINASVKCWKEKKEKKTLMLPPTWIMLLLHFRVGLSLCIVLKHRHCKNKEVNIWMGANKLAGTYPFYHNAPRFPHGCWKIPVHLDSPTMIG